MVVADVMIDAVDGSGRRWVRETETGNTLGFIKRTEHGWIAGTDPAAAARPSLHPTWLHAVEQLLV